MKQNQIIDYLMNQKLSEFSFFINNICNLKCKHCYVGAKVHGNDISLKKWKSVIDEVVFLGVKIIGIVGKEPLLTPDKTFDLIRYIKQKYPKTNLGFVTNGTLLKNHAEIICKLNIDYIDVSIDGIKTQHDYIRGQGNFQKTFNGIKKLIKSGFSKEKLFLSITLTNKTNLIEIIKFFDKENIANFVISPYMIFSHNSKELKINEIRFFEKFMTEIKQLKTKNRINLLIKTDYVNLNLIKYFLSKKYIDLKNLKYDKQRNIIFTEENINNLSISFNFLPFSTELIREIRVTSDGYVLSCLDQGYPDYKKRSIGNIKENTLKEILNNQNSKKIIRNKILKNLEEIQEVFVQK